jgi:hypothetical protein
MMPQYIQAIQHRMYATHICKPRNFNSEKGSGSAQDLVFFEFSRVEAFAAFSTNNHYQQPTKVKKRLRMVRVVQRNRSDCLSFNLCTSIQRCRSALEKKHEQK